MRVLDGDPDNMWFINVVVGLPNSSLESTLALKNVSVVVRIADAKRRRTSDGDDDR